LRKSPNRYFSPLLRRQTRRFLLCVKKFKKLRFFGKSGFSFLKRFVMIGLSPRRTRRPAPPFDARETNGAPPLSVGSP
jgi:hypothetical protein